MSHRLLVLLNTLRFSAAVIQQDTYDVPPAKILLEWDRNNWHMYTLKELGSVIKQCPYFYFLKVIIVLFLLQEVGPLACYFFKRILILTAILFSAFLHLYSPLLRNFNEILNSLCSTTCRTIHLKIPNVANVHWQRYERYTALGQWWLTLPSHVTVLPTQPFCVFIPQRMKLLPLSPPQRSRHTQINGTSVTVRGLRGELVKPSDIVPRKLEYKFLVANPAQQDLLGWDASYNVTLDRVTKPWKMIHVSVTEELLLYQKINWKQ